MEIHDPIQEPATARAARRRPLQLRFGYPDDHLPRLELPEAPQRRFSRGAVALAYCMALLVAACCAWLHHAGRTYVPARVSWLWVLPFCVVIALMAVAPFALRRWWERWYPAAMLAPAAAVAIYYFASGVARAEVLAQAGSLISFIYIIGALYVISCGMLVRLHFRPSPLANTLLLAAGTLLSNLVGSTGAAVLLIRPYMALNGKRLRAYHIVFFIFLVASVGPFLAPIGPPLFLAYFLGTPFWWFAHHCWPEYVCTVLPLLAIFFAWDVLAGRRPPVASGTAEPAATAVEAPAETATPHGRHVHVVGAGNLVCVGMVVVALFMPAGFREAVIATAAFVTLMVTPPAVHAANRFHLSLVKELAIIYLGVFITMAPALHLLYQHANDRVVHRALGTPGQNYFAAGTLTSILDNAPTYLAFLQLERGRVPPHLLHAAAQRLAAPAAAAGKHDVGRMVRAYRYYFPGAGRTGQRQRLEMTALLALPRYRLFFIAISLGSAFFGALTYIGNAPNYLVKSIAEHAGVKCPSFLGFILYYALPVMLPVLLLVWWLFLR